MVVIREYVTKLQHLMCITSPKRRGAVDMQHGADPVSGGGGGDDLYSLHHTVQYQKHWAFSACFYLSSPLLSNTEENG